MSKCPECEEGLPEWIMSYADMITILMAFFVVMYSMAGEKDKKKEEAVMNSLRVWLGGTHAPWPEMSAGGSTRTQRAGGGPRLSSTRPPIPVNLKGPSTAGHTIYCSATAGELSDENKTELAAAIDSLAGKRHLVEIRGRPSRRPLPAGSSFHDQVDLTYAKCRRVRDFLIAKGIEPERIQILLATGSAPGADDDAQLLAHDARIDVLLGGQVLAQPTAGGAQHSKPAPTAPASNQH